MFKRHFFLIAAACLIGLMVLAAVWRVAFGGDEKAAAGPRAGGRGQQVAVAVVGQRPFNDRVVVLG
ncbi:MAG: efflux transporter periplasmic adaptor subunit, partial [Brevundimonas sp.]